MTGLPGRGETWGPGGSRGGESAPARGPRVMVELSPAELIRRITLLEVAFESPRPGDRSPRAAEELARLVAARDAALPADPALDDLTDALREINADLSALQADLRDCEAREAFGDEFVALARAALRLEADRRRIEAKIDALATRLLAQDRAPRSG